MENNHTPHEDPSSTTPLTPSEQDDLTLKQTEQIFEEITTTTPLISSLLPLPSTLHPLYDGDAVYTKKIDEIATNFNIMRRTRPDGNCFYRAVLFRLFESALESPTMFTELEDKFKGWKNLLTEAGYTQFTVEDFYDNFGESIALLPRMNEDGASITSSFFSSTATCDYLTVFLRILTAAELTRNSSFYSNFLSDGFDSVVEFSKAEVEPMGKEADHLQIIALATALQIGIRVVYMDRGESIVQHNFPEDMPTYPIVMLYRPGHYDLIYQLL